MINLIMAASMAAQVVSVTGGGHQGWWCYAKAPSGAMVLEQEASLEAAKNKARVTCTEQYGQGCQVAQCYENSPYKYTCVGGLESETRMGGFRAYSNCEDLARSSVLRNCAWHHGCSDCCLSICFENFEPPKEE